MVELTSREHSYTGGSHARSDARLRLAVVCDRDAALSRLTDIPRSWVHSAYQDPRLLSLWLAREETKPFLIEFPTPSGPVLLPLQTYDDCTARYIGGRHANGNFPIGSCEAIKALGIVDRRTLRLALHREPSTPCSLVLERQLAEAGDLANPFVDNRSARSPNVALSLSIADGFDAVLAERNAKRMRKKARSSQRKLEEIGSVALVVADGPEQSILLLDRFFDLKSRRFQELGIFDVFADASTRQVFRSLFANKNQNTDGAYHTIHALCVNEKPIAVIGCTEFGTRVTVEFGAFDNEFAFASPGDLLFFRTIENYCAQGFEIFDFGIGDEVYKRRWCDIETWQADTFVAANFRGQLIAMANDIRTHTVRALKSNPTLWATAKKLRKSLSGSSRSHPKAG
ncbi:MAG: GNAT family N-acetyltransferase [Pseudomonadota bacterium]